ncbi:MAG: hypothetical protein AAGA68_24970 [Pseudomonadota bacterium]
MSCSREAMTMTKDEAMKVAAEALRYHANWISDWETVQRYRKAADVLCPPPPEPQTVLTTRERPCEVVPEGCVVHAYDCNSNVGRPRYYPSGEHVGKGWLRYALIRLVPGDGE